MSTDYSRITRDGLWDNNVVFAQMLALCPTLAVTGSATNGLGMGLATTAVLVVTEFGRQVAINGTNGTDHGSGGVAFLAGGAVRGGRVLGDWPGLAPKDRFEGRDLRITTDLRALLHGLLHEHLQVPRATLDASVLPGVGTPLRDLIRS